METPPLHDGPSGIGRTRLWPWLLVAAVIIFTGTIRLRLLNVPLERDEGEYAYLGQLMSHGIPPYELVYSMKLPGTGFCYLLGMGLFGQTSAGIHLTLLVAHSITLVFIFLLGRRLADSLVGVVAAAGYGVMALSPTVAGLAAHATHFVVLFAVPATLLLIKALVEERSKLLLASGFLFGLAFLMKQQGLCFGMFAITVLVWRGWRHRDLISVRFAKRIFWFGVGLALPFVLACVLLAGAGVFQRFWFWTVSYARQYEGSLSVSDGWHSHLLEHLKQSRDLSCGFWILAVVGVAAALCLPRRRMAAGFGLGWWFFSFVGTAAGLYFREHYFILLLPAFAILLGLAVAGLRDLMPTKMFPDLFGSLPVIAFGLIVSWMVFYNAPLYFQWPVDKVGAQLYRENPFAEAVAAADLIRAHSKSDARVAVLGSEPEIYFYAQRRSATGYIYTYPLMESQPYARVMQQEMAHEIESAQPEFLVEVPYPLSWLPQPHSDGFLTNWFASYAGKFYEKVGVAGFSSEGKLVSGWGAEAANVAGLLNPHLIIFQRRTQH